MTKAQFDFPAIVWEVTKMRAGNWAKCIVVELCNLHCVSDNLKSLISTPQNRESFKINPLKPNKTFTRPAVGGANESSPLYAEVEAVQQAGKMGVVTFSLGRFIWLPPT